MATFRVATINVHGFSLLRQYEKNIDDLVSILKPLNLDLIAGQEIEDTYSWNKFCRLLSVPNSIFGHSENEFVGNGIASRHPIQSYTNLRSSFSCRGGTRALLQCCLDGFDDLTFAVTHLDHLDEDDRLTQISEFNPSKENIDILMGDFNALTRDDYSDEYYRDIVVEKRKISEWEKPRFDVTKLITHKWNYQDAFKQINPMIKEESIATCAYGTRIDYIYIHPRVNKQWTLTECSIIDTKRATDHNAVFAEFKRLEK